MIAAAVALVVLLVAGGIYGPQLLGAASATLSRYPRLGMAVWSCAAALWTVALLLVGPVLTWIISGPALPGSLGVACQRCLSAANPFTRPLWDLGVPAVVLLAVPTLMVAALAVRATVRYLLGRYRLREHRHVLERVAERRSLHGTRVWVSPDTSPDVYCLPGVGVVVTGGALSTLSEIELVTVLEHERAHLAQRHHLLIGAVRTLRAVLGWIPLVRAAPQAVVAYAEMAADDAARRRTSTPALASALLSLGSCAPPSRVGLPAPGLHAASDPAWRVRRLALDCATPAAPVLRIGGCLATMAVVIATISVPYLGVVLGPGC